MNNYFRLDAVQSLCKRDRLKRLKEFFVKNFLTFGIIFFFVVPVHSQNISTKMYDGMKWRLVGPFRAGWATMSAGVHDSLNTFYFGSAGGGVWKTSDAGRTWHALMQHEPSSSIGAIAVAPSNGNIIYVGTGQVALRYDILSGDGVYRSTDAGNSWQNIGLKKTRHIGRIIVDPSDPNKIIVAALGQVFASDNDRGIYVSSDGGKNWKHTLFVNDSTGAVDLASDPAKPSIIYAALWQMQMHPWLDYFDSETGNGSGIYKSDDGGEHWKKLSGGGLPNGALGRIGLAVADNSGGKIIYATIIAKDGMSGLYRSNDGGDTWQFVNKDGALANSYFSRITVDPKNPDIVYVMGRSISRSEDGGKTFTFFKGAPGGDDYHFLWINPDNANYMITASDQGAVVTVNGGASWSSWYNQPTGQFYHLAADDRFPYRIYSGQQDNGTIEILSRGPYGVIEDKDWHPVGGDERDYDVPKPGDPDMVFGSGLGGTISRFDEVTRQSGGVAPWPVSSYGAFPPSVRYRYTWITPLVFSPVGKHTLYFASQYLFKSNDNGNNWNIISPDLSGKSLNPDLKKNSEPGLEQALKGGFGVIFCIAPSPITEKEIWVGTDDGLIQLTTDGGKNWKNVTPASIPNWARIDVVDPSPFSMSTAYAAANTHRLGKYVPLIFKTDDFGKHWTKITSGLPEDEFVNVVRSDTKQKDLLFAGTNRSVYVSFNDGANWHPLSLNFPTTDVTDLLVHGNDLIASTQGRAIWILDDLEPLREIAKGINPSDNYLFKPASAWRLRGDENRDTPWPHETPLGTNPPDGAVIDYLLPNNAKALSLTILDMNGLVIRKFSPGEEEKNLPSSRYFEKGWVPEKENISTASGMHRFVWDLRYERPPALFYHYSIGALWEDRTPLMPQGSLVLPGKYTAELNVDGKKYVQQFEVKMDPRVHVSLADLKQQLQFAQVIDSGLTHTVEAHNEIENVIKNNKGKISNAQLDSLSAIADKGENNLSSIAEVLAGLVSTVQSADAAPTQGQHDVYNYYNKQLQIRLEELKRIKKKMN